MDGATVRKAAAAHAARALDLLERFAGIESPTDDPRAVARMQDAFAEEFESRGFRTRRLHRPGAGPHLFVRPERRRRERPLQLLLGHADTVWPIGTLAEMPVERRDGRLHGPGTFDMKAGITGFLVALDIVRELGLELPADPIMLINADEETGSPTSKELVARVARIASRAWVLEPPKGPDGHLKTVRKGMVRIGIGVQGRPAHAGLDPGVGASAIEELSHLIQALHAMQDLERGVSVNVGVIEGGTRPNVVAARARLECDARTPTRDDALELIERVRALQPTVPGTTLQIDARLEVPPLEASPRNRRLWDVAKRAAASVGIEVEEAHVGGASDGNTASAWTATLDGLGWVGDGAHAHHEHVVIEHVAERIALLVALLTAPLDDA